MTWASDLDNLAGGTVPEPAQSVPSALLDLAAHRLKAGGVVLDTPECVESVWGDGHRCLWARGEPFLLCGPDGVGKTTIAQQLVLHLISVRLGGLLGLPTGGADRVLYVAADRPTQALRSIRRMVTGDDRTSLDQRLAIWRGPLPFDLAKEPLGLLELAHRAGAVAVVIDSLKDVCGDLSREESGQGLNMAFQHAVAEGVEVCALHHQRKQQSNGGKPRALADVYGSRWLTAGAGSVVMLWGEAGDLVVELCHLKQPDETVGPLQVIHDHVTGASRVEGSIDPWVLVQEAVRGVTAGEVAIRLFGVATPDRNQVEKARRRLESLAKDGKIHKVDGARGGRAGEKEPSRYYPQTSERNGL